MRKVHAQLARHDLRQRRLAKARGTMEQDVIHRLAPRRALSVNTRRLARASS
jgi:hypothetical protein